MKPPYDIEYFKQHAHYAVRDIKNEILKKSDCREVICNKIAKRCIEDKILISNYYDREKCREFLKNDILRRIDFYSWYHYDDEDGNPVRITIKIKNPVVKKAIDKYINKSVADLEEIIQDLLVEYTWCEQEFWKEYTMEMVESDEEDKNLLRKWLVGLEERDLPLKVKSGVGV